MAIRRTAFVSILILICLPFALNGQTPAEEAQARLDYLVGIWDATTTVFNREGDVVRTEQSVDLIEPLIGTKVLMTTVIGAGTVRKTIRFFDQAEQLYYEIGVGEAGDVWILSGGMDDYVTTSQIRSTPNGGKVMVRFTHTNVQPNSFEAQMEVSRDEGKTWTRSNTKQRLVRRTSVQR